MRRGIAVTWHALSFLVVAALYFFFVLPRWWELLGSWPHGVGTAARIITGLLLGLTALPVALTLAKTRKPEFGTPQLALTLRGWSIVGHVAAGALIVAAAIAEIWLDLDVYGRGLFAAYGAAAAIALLGAAAFYLAYAAELPPPPPKPLKPKREHGRKKLAAAKADEAQAADTSADEQASDNDSSEAADESTEERADETEAADSDAADPAESAEPAAADESEEAAGPTGKRTRRGLRNRRPSKTP